MTGAIAKGMFVSGGRLAHWSSGHGTVQVPRGAFLRDAVLFLCAVLVCYVVTSGEVYPRHAIGFILYYLAFVCLVIVSDVRERRKRLIQGAEEGESLGTWWVIVTAA